MCIILYSTARVPVTNLCVDISMLNEVVVTWQIEKSVKQQVKHCYAEIVPEGGSAIRSSPTNSQYYASFTDLQPNADHTAKVITVYNDGVKVSSKSKPFKTAG